MEHLNLESLARVGEYPARVEAARSLVELDRPEPEVGAAGSRKSTTTSSAQSSGTPTTSSHESPEPMMAWTSIFAAA